MKIRITIISFMVMLLMVSSVWAQDSTEHKDGAEMAAMGVPAQMQEIAFLVGTWSVVGRMKMDPSSEDWTEYSATTVYTLICGGAAIQSTFSMPFMGGQMEGFAIQSFDRENDQWQVTWTDNIGGRQSYYSGFRKDGKTVMVGEEKLMGMTSLARMTNFDETETSFKWTMEQSIDGGKSWVLIMDGLYTKQ